MARAAASLRALTDPGGWLATAYKLELGERKVHTVPSRHFHEDGY